MARRYRRSRLKRRLRRMTYRKRFSSFKRTFGTRKRRIGRIAPVSNRKKVKGFKTRVSYKTETKRVTYGTSGQAIRNFTNWDAQLALGNINNASLLWSNNGNDNGGTAFFTAPVQGDNENEVTGVKYVMKYVEINFLLMPAYLVPTVYNDAIRLILVKERNANTVINTAGTAALAFFQFARFITPLRTKTWDVQMDRIIPYTTGLTQNQAAPNANYHTLGPKPIRMRMIVPMRKSLRVPAAATNTSFPLRFYLYAFTKDMDQYWYISDLSAVYYYVDP